MELELRTMRTEVRATNDFALEGRAASYNVRSQNLGGFVETIAPGAFTKSLNANPDVKCTFNHDPNHVLGRTKSGTLTLTDSAGGLDFRCQLDKTNSYHRDIYASVKRGDVDQCSFAFTVPDGGDELEENAAVDDSGKRCHLRTLRTVNLMDVSAVTYPAYNASGATQVSARALALAKLKSDPTLLAASDAARRSVARAQEKKITAQSDADRRARAERLGKQIAADAETEKKNDQLRYRMQAAAGRVDSRDAYPDRQFFLDLQLGKVRS
jgi:HK97 family phage prohead protease